MKYYLLLAMIIPSIGLCLATNISPERQVLNLIAFTRLWGYVKHWCPSDEAQDIDWDRFAIHGSRQILSAATDEELRDALDALFHPIVPNLELFGHERPPSVFQPPMPGLKQTFWQYEGYNNTGQTSSYRSIRTNRPLRIPKNEDYPHSWANFELQMPPIGKGVYKMRLSFRICQTREGSPATAIYLGCGDARAEDSLLSTAWTDKSYILEEGLDATQPLQLIFMSLDSLQLDDLQVEIWQDDAWVLKFRQDFSLDEPGTLPSGLNVSISSLFSGIGQNVDVLVEEVDGQRVLAVHKSESELPYTLGIVDRIFPEEPQPNELLEKELIPGVNCRFPLSLPCDMHHSYPIPDSAKLEALKQSYADADPEDRTDPHVWLAGLIKYWNELSFFYPYFEYDICDWDQELPLALERVLSSKDFAQYKQALLLLMSCTQDGHAFLSDQAHNSKMPLFNTYPIGGKWIVSKVLDDSLGIPAGSEVTEMNGTNFARLMSDNRPYFIAGNPQTTDMRLFSRYLKTYADSVATFSFITPQGKKIKRKLEFHEYKGWNWVTPDVKIVSYPDGIVYINPNAITDEELQAAFPELVAARGIILDLRYYLSISTGFISNLLSEPDSLANVSIKRYIRPHEELLREEVDKPTWGCKPTEPHIGGKLVALCGPNSQSYCEMYLAVLQHNKRSTLVGQPTSGANGDVIATPLPGGLDAYWTGMLVRQADHSRFHGVGIIPDVEVEQSLDDIVQGRDAVLKKGLEILRAQMD